MIALSEHTAYYTNKAGMIFFIREMATELGRSVLPPMRFRQKTLKRNVVSVTGVPSK